MSVNGIIEPGEPTLEAPEQSALNMHGTLVSYIEAINDYTKSRDFCNNLLTSEFKTADQLGDLSLEPSSENYLSDEQVDLLIGTIDPTKKDILINPHKGDLDDVIAREIRRKATGQSLETLTEAELSEIMPFFEHLHPEDLKLINYKN